MPGIADIAPDQRAVLSLIVRRHKSYAEIADALQIDEQAVYERAHAALAELAGERADGLSASAREQIGDYLLGQQSPSERLITYDHLEGSPAARSFAEAVTAELASIPAATLPQIPEASEASRGAPPSLGDISGPPETARQPPRAVGSKATTRATRRKGGAGTERTQRARTAAEGPEPPSSRRPPDDVPLSAPKSAFQSGADDGLDVSAGKRSRRDRVAGVRALPSSRLGGAIVLAAIAVGAILAVVLTTSSGGGTGGTQAGSAAAQRAAPGTGATGSGAGGGGHVHLEKQLKLTPPEGGGSAAGEAAVLSDSGRYVIALAAEKLPPSQGFFYAAWLYNSPTQAYALGKAPAVGSNGQLKPVAQALPEGAGAYHQLIITKETSEHPTHPGEIVLSGPFSLH
jgi:hypothetical protein